jgi:hypothetical protein
MRIGLVGSVTSVGSRPVPARELDPSPLFGLRRRHVERTCDRWFVLSTTRGLVAPDTIVAPETRRLRDLTVAERETWSSGVIVSLEYAFGIVGPHVFEVHADREYREHGLVDGLRARGATVEVPIEGVDHAGQVELYARDEKMSLPRDAVTAVELPSAAEGNGAPRGGLFARLARRSVRRSVRGGSAEVAVDGLAVGDALEASAVGMAGAGGAIDALELGAFTHRWPKKFEEFTNGWEFTHEGDGRRVEVRHGLGRRNVFGRERVTSVTWIDGVAVLEGVEAEDYPASRALVALLKSDRKDVRDCAELGGEYSEFEIVVHREEVHGPRARSGLAAKIGEDDLERWARLARLQARDRGRAVESGPPAGERARSRSEISSGGS